MLPHCAPSPRTASRAPRSRACQVLRQYGEEVPEPTPIVPPRLEPYYLEWEHTFQGSDARPEASKPLSQEEFSQLFSEEGMDLEMPDGVDLGDLRKIRHKNLCVVGGPCCKAFLKRAAAPGMCAQKGKGHVKHNHLPSSPQLTGLRLRAAEKLGSGMKAIATSGKGKKAM